MINEYQGFKICHALPTGGKAGKGRNKTTSIRAMLTTYPFSSKVFSYKVREQGAKELALKKALEWIDKMQEAVETILTTHGPGEIIVKPGN